MNAVAQPTIHSLKTANVDSDKRKVWAGRTLGGVVCAFLLFDAVMKLVKAPPVVAGAFQLGFSESSVVSIGAMLLACTTLYLLPRTSILGAIFLTGYLGGAVACQFRVGASLFNILFPAVFAGLAWIALYLRNERFRSALS